MERPGFRVNGRFYSPSQRSQAIARAEFLAVEYGRDVSVHRVDFDGSSKVEHLARFDSNSMSNSLLMVM